MSDNADAKQGYLRALGAMGDDLPGKGQDWLRDLRERARARFEETGFPSMREEAWRYTNLAPLMRQVFAPAPAGEAVNAPQLEPFAFPELHAFRLVFVNGRYRADLSTPTKHPGVVAASLAGALAQPPRLLQEHLGSIATLARSSLVALNTAFLADGAYVHLSAGTMLESPIHLIFVGTEDVLAQPRTLIVAETGSNATVIEQYIGFDEGRCFTNAVTEIALQGNAKIEHYRLQQQGRQAYHVGGLHLRQERGSEFVSHAVDLGGLLVRHDIHSVLGEGASCALNGLYLAGGRQHVDNHTVVEHAEPRSTSRELYKGVLDGRARGVFNGRVVVHPDAQESDARQTNNNLLLSEDAEIDTKPELEIYADNVKCSHGATVGQLDPDQLFYLRARAVDEATARDLLTFAFANDVLLRFRLAPIRAALDRLLMERLLQGRTIKEVELV